MTALLQVRDLTRRFGGLVAVPDIAFDMRESEIFGVIGPNGAGKTTLFNVIAGHYRPSAGAVTFQGTDVSGHSSDEIARRGVARTFQAVHVFKDETVRENLQRAERISRRYDPFAFVRNRNKPPAADMTDVAAFIGLTDRLDIVAGDMAYGERKLLGVGVAMMVSPKLMLMDEPAAGLNPSEKKGAATLIRRLRDERGVSVLLVEHDMPLVMGVCDRILVVNQGRRVALGSPAEIKAEPAVIDAYLGEEYEFA